MTSLRARWVYETTVSVAIVASVLYELSVTLVADLVAGAARALGGPRFVLLLVSTMAALTLAAMQRIGPVWATRLELQWRNPILLLPSRQRAVAMGVGAATVLAGVLVLLGSRTVPAAASWSGPVTALIVLLCAAGAYVGECLDRRRWVQAAGVIAAVVAAAVMCAAGGPVPLGVLGLCLAYTLSAPPRMWHVARAGAWTNPPARWTLLRAGAFVEALRASVVMLDAAALGVLRDVERQPTRPWSPRRASRVLTLRTVTSARVAVVLPALPLPAGAQALWGANAAAVVLLVSCFFFAWRTATLPDAYLEQPSLRRSYAHRGRLIPALLALIPVSLTPAYATAGAAIGGLSPAATVLALAIAVLGVLRRASGRRLAGRVGALVSTPMGPIPLDLARRVVAGGDVLVVGASLALGGVGSAAAAVILAGAYWVAFTARGR